LCKWLVAYGDFKASIISQFVQLDLKPTVNWRNGYGSEVKTELLDCIGNIADKLEPSDTPAVYKLASHMFSVDGSMHRPDHSVDSLKDRLARVEYAKAKADAALQKEIKERAAQVKHLQERYDTLERVATIAMQERDNAQKENIEFKQRINKVF
jgi:hypothetical protein